MDVLIILLGFAILSAMFVWLSREVREINPYLSIIFLIGSLLFLIFVAATIYQAANVGEQVISNTTQINNWGLCPNNGNSTGTFSNSTYEELMPCISNVTILYNYTYTTNFKSFAVDSPVIVLEWLVFLLIAIFMLMELIKLIKGVRRIREEGIGSGF
jgi:predicted PurR-regulated permease PerM